MATRPDTGQSDAEETLGSGKSTSGSLAFRRNKDQILAGDVPEKYSRLLPFVPGRRVLELGAAEGVLSLLLAEQKEWVFALEMKEGRHEEALRLQSHWRKLGRDVDRCQMILGNILDRRDLLEQVDTLVAVRSIYYLRENIHDVFAAVGRHVEHVVLCGNRNRARKFAANELSPDDKLGQFNFYATEDGMREILEDSGYAITEVVSDGDPIVIGRKKDQKSGH